MNERLRVGIIGLGRRWRARYAPALAALSDLFEIAAVYDPVPQRASVEAARLHCSAAAGASELIERDDVGAVLLLDLGWQRLWPIERAAGAGKPLFCLPELADDADHADTLARCVQETGLSVMMAVRAAFTPAALRLAELREELLGPIRLAACESTLGRQGLPDSGLLAWVLSLLGAAPEGITAAGNAAAGLESFTLDLAGGKVLQLTRWRGSRPRGGLRLRLWGERGQATLLTPHRLSWTVPEGVHSLTLARGQSVEHHLLTRFHAVATQGQAPSPGLGDAHRALLCWQAAERSRTEGRRVTLSLASRGA